ncbi:MAG TPA: S8 family serine peptidase [Jatrophihabitantaceae bacterium]|jgi:subtilisin family serine protease
MKRLALVLALVGAVLVAPVTASAEPAFIDVVVVLKSHANVAGVQAPTRAAQLAGVERALRDVAARTQSGILQLLAQRPGSVAAVTPLWIVNAIEVKATPDVIREVAARPEVATVQPNATIQAPAAVTSTAAEPNLTKVNAPALWDLGYRGQGVVVASMDTGVDATHPDLAASWRGGSNSWYDPNGQHTTPVDVNGHGTQTIGVMVGGSAGGTSIGMAPDAKWIAVKIFNDSGQATTSGIHQGFQWLLDPDGNLSTPDAPNVVNDSWTMSSASCALDFQLDLRSLRAAGILPVFAAGNYGPTPGTVLSPANLPEAFAVGGTDNADAIYPYSSRGPSSCAGATAPALAAPATSVRTSDLYGGYVSETGTSMAAPHVSGALALLLGAVPGLSADQQAAALEGSAVDLGAAGLDNDFGYGRLDVLAAYHQVATNPDYTVSVSPSSATVAAGSSASYTVTVTGVNGFAGDVVLSLSGLPPSVGSATFSPAVVSGGGTSQLTVTTSASAPPGTYPLTITGTSGTTTHAAPASLVVPQPPDFSFGVTPSARTVNAGSPAGYIVSVGSLYGFTGDVAVSLSALPASVGSATFSPAVVSGTGTSALTVTTLGTAPGGTYQLTITGTSAGLTHTATVSLTVQARDFTLSATPASITITRGKTGSYSVAVGVVNGFTGNVTLSVSGVPSGSTVSWSANPVAAPGTSTLGIRTTGSTPRGTFTVNVTGTNGTLVHQVTVTLIVR